MTEVDNTLKSQYNPRILVICLTKMSEELNKGSDTMSISISKSNIDIAGEANGNRYIAY